MMSSSSTQTSIFSSRSSCRAIKIKTRRQKQSAKIVRASSVTEPATKIQFNEKSENNANLQLLGVGAREKKIAILTVKVYAVAMYADASKMTASDVDLLNGDFEKEILIQLNMNVEGKDFFKALEEALVPRISRIATDMATKEDDEGNFMTTTAEYSEQCEELALEELELIRDGLCSKSGGSKKLEKGAKISFTFKESGGDVAMVMSSSGAEITFKSYELARALLDVYVGDDPISVEAKKAFELGASR